MDEKDIYRVAKLLIDQHRVDASIHAATWVDAMLENGDQESPSVWKRGGRAIEALWATETRLRISGK